MRINARLNYIWLVAIQFLLSVAGFLNFWTHPNDSLFCDFNDGLKNIFTMVRYVSTAPGKDGLFKYNGGCYPFGEYVYYTDNTPLFSIPFRAFCWYVHDISGYTVLCYNLFIIANIIVCSLLVYRVFSLLFHERLFSFIMAIALPWINMAMFRIPCGHLNLSFTSLIMAAIYLVVLWHRHRDEQRRLIRIGVYMCALTLLSFLVHGYFLAIIGIFIASMLVFYGLANYKERIGKLSLIWSMLYLFCSVGLVTLMLIVTDKYFFLRKENAMGYDFIKQKVHFSALFTHYSYNDIYFPIASRIVDDDVERAAYLGNTGLYLVLFLGVAMCFSAPARKKIVDIQKQFFNDKLPRAILLGSLVLLSISFGEIYATSENGDGYNIINILNPFFYLHYFTRRVEQFRSLERFVYPFYFGFYIWVTFTLVALYRQADKKMKLLLVSSVIFLSGIEVKDTLTNMRHETNHANLLNATEVAKLTLPKTDLSAYQAILPIPYYCIGSEDYDNTIDVYQPWARYTYKLSLATKLPSMAFVLSRVPPAHNLSILNCIADDKTDESMSKLLSAKPILVVYNKKYAADTLRNCVPGKQSTLNYYRKICEFPARHHLVPIDSTGDVVFYSWQPKG